MSFWSTKALIILGIGDSHESHACVIRDGAVVAAVAEERLTRLKADIGFPKLAIEEAMRLAGITTSDIDHVAIAGAKSNMFLRLYKRDAVFSVQDWVRQNRDFWRPRLLEGREVSEFEDFENFRHLVPDVENDPYYPVLDQLKNAPRTQWQEITRSIRAKVVADQIGIAQERIAFYRHEDCHIAYGHLSSPYEPNESAVFTIEGKGDDSTATVNRVSAGGEISPVWSADNVQLGRVYRMMTLLLGMKPLQHEYKVMGLAPYGSAYNGTATLELLSRMHTVSGYRITEAEKLPDLYYTIRDALEGERFDGIAWGLQQWTEQLLCDWIGQGLAELNMDNLVLSGGVAQNIKAMKAIAELDEVKQLWVPPIAGDGSLGIGAAWLAHMELCPDQPARPFSTVYMGTDCSRSDVERMLKSQDLQAEGFEAIADVSADRAAQWLDEGLILARCAGRMEFGQRALGNRSIIADPRRAEAVERINRKIKNRDFWMPFTPSVLAEHVNDVVVNPKQLYSPFMTMAFDLAPAWHGKLPAVIHPADHTVRPQMLRPEDNPGYHALISAFHDRTGVPLVLNTSFNLHGEPIARTPEDAMHILRNSDLDIVLFDDIAVARRLKAD
jgi:carbamoyltransferase